MIKFNLYGGGFIQDMCSSAFNKNKYVEWVTDNSADVSLYVDNAINWKIENKKVNYGWIAESSSIIPGVIDKVISNLDEYRDKFTFIFTHDKRIIEKDPDFFKFTIPNACPYIRKKQIYIKTKLCSAIVSNKSFTSGHTFRLKEINKFRDKIDFFGRGSDSELPYYFIEDGKIETGKIKGLKDYYFSFAFENDNYNSIFCEKLTDCFATGTIPIFWGTKDIDEYFNKDGIILYDDNFDFNMLTKNFYKSKMKSIKENFYICCNLETSEDYIFLNYFE